MDLPVHDTQIAPSPIFVGFYKWPKFLLSTIFYYTEEVMCKPLEIIMQKVIFFAMKQKCVDDVTDHCFVYVPDYSTGRYMSN